MANYEDENTERPEVGTQPNQVSPARDADLIAPRDAADEDETLADEDEDIDLDDEDEDDQDDDDADEDEDSDTDSDNDSEQRNISVSGDGGINDGVAGNTVNMGKSINDSAPGVLGGSMGGGFGSGA